MTDTDIFGNHLPLGSLDIVSTGETAVAGKITIKVEARRVKYDDLIDAPGTPNAWCYIRSGSAHEFSSTLDNYLGPVINVWRGQPLKVAWVNKLGSMPVADSDQTPAACRRSTLSTCGVWKKFNNKSR